MALPMLTHTRRSILAVFLGSLLGAGFGSGFNPALADHNDAPSAPQNADTQLIMVEQTGCAYCARWNAEISDIYPKTPEGKFAPLRRIDLHAPRPTDVTFNGPLVVTPTFVLVEDGHETARIEGYGGDEMFWAMLTVTLQNHSTFDLQATE